MKTAPVYTHEGYTLRLARHEDAEEYFSRNFDPLDPEVARLTGCKPQFTHDEVVSFFHKCVDADDRYDFLILAPDGSIVGESVINEIDDELRCANYRVAIFRPTQQGKGIGSWAVRMAQTFAFETLELHRLQLDVFSFNPRAKRVYEHTGFRVEGTLRDAVRDGDTYADDILMAILENEWRNDRDAK